MKKRMRIVIWIGILIGLFLLIYGNAAAEGTYPVNPDQAIVRELDRLGNKIGRRDGGAIVRGVSVTETQTPSLDQHGKWTIALTETPNGETLTEVRVAIQSPDPDGEYSTEFQIRLSENIAESCDFVAPGNYRIVAYYFFSGGTCYMGYQDFSISLDETHTAEDYPTVAQKVNQIVAECQVTGNDWQTALNLHDWLTHHVFYDRTYSFYGAEDALLRGTGVCDSYSKAYCYLLRAAGITVQRVHSDTHAWNVITLGNTEYHVDVTWDDPVMADENGIINRPVSGGEQYVYFCINDNLIYGFLDENAEHATGKTYTGATSLAESYLIHTNKWQDGGQYWDDETGNLGIYRDLIVDSIPNRAVGAFTVPADQDCIIEIFDDGRASACTGNEAYAKWARYFYAYKLNETGIPGLDGFTVTYDPEEMIFRATVGDGIILIDDKGNILQNGDSLSGKIQYKIRVANLPAGCDKLQFTWDDQNLNATAPAEWQDDWRGLEQENGKNYFYLMPELIGTYNSEVMFVRTGESDQNHRYITLNYNRTPKYDIPVSITNTTVPEYKENNYALTWSGSGSADFCVVIWEKPNESWEMFFCSNDGILRLEDYPEDMNPLDETGDHRVTIFAIKDDCIWMRPTAWSFAVAAPDPVLRVDPTNNDAKRVFVGDDGSVTAAMHQWINFDVSAPGSCSGVGIYWLYTDPATYPLSEEQSLSDVQGIPDYARCADCWPGDGWEEFTWTMNDAPDGLSGDSYTVYMVAEAQYDNWTKYKRAVLPVTVSVDQAVTGAVSYTVPETLNTFVNGVAQVARDGELIIEVNNEGNDADFYGAYILKDGFTGGVSSPHYWDWMSDSHLSTRESSAGTTQVQLPIPRCVAGEDYVVHVYAVKFGAPLVEAAATTTIHAVEANESGEDIDTRGEVILSMKNSYDTGERLMIYACYLQPKNPLHDVGWMDVQIYPENEPENPIYEKGGDWSDFYDVDMVIWESGKYTAVARAMAYIEGQGTVTLAQSPEKTITVNNSGVSVPPTIPSDYNILNKAFTEGSTFTICLPLNENDTEDIYFAELYGTQTSENGPKIDDNNFVAEAKRDGNGDFTFRMGWRDGQVQPGTYAVVFSSATRGKNKCYDFNHIFYFDVRMNPELEIKWDKAENENYDYEIPVHKEFTVHINAYGATTATLDMGGGYDMGPIRLDYFYEWVSGEWGKNHENIELKVAYDESCQNKGVASFPIQVTADYGCPDEGETAVKSGIAKVYCSSEGQIDVAEWEPLGYYTTDQDGNVIVCSAYDDDDDNDWQAVPESGLTLARGKMLMIMDLAESGKTIGSTGFFGAFMRINTDGQADWSAPLYDRNVVFGQEWMTLSTARIATVAANGEVQAKLWLSTWKEGYDTKEKVYPITITNALEAENEEVYWNISGADSNGNVRKWTHDWIRIQVYVPDAAGIEIIGTNEHGWEMYHDGCDGDLFVDSGWRTDTDGMLTFKAIATSENGGKTEYTYPGTVTILTHGNLPAPKVTITNAVDGKITEGQNIQFIFMENEGLEAFFADTENHPGGNHVWYNAYLWGEDGDMMGEALEKVQPGTPLTFKTDDLESGNVYRLSVDVQQEKYTGVATDVWFLLKPKADEGTPTVAVVAVEGLEKDGTVPVNRDVTFRVVADQPEDIEIQGVDFFDGDEWREIDRDNPEDDWEVTKSFCEERTYPVYARVNVKGYPKTVITNVLYITGTKTGETGPFTFSITDGMDETNRITRGEPVTVTYTAAKNANHYWVDIEEYNPDWEDWNWVDHQADLKTDGTAGGTGTVLTAELEAGKTYRMYAVADAIGYVRAETKPVQFTVTEPTFEPDETGILLRVVGADQPIQTGDELFVSAYAPGADWIDLRIDAENENSWQSNYGGDSFSDQVRPYWNEGTYQMVARAWYPVVDENENPVWEMDERGNYRLDSQGNKIQERNSVDSEPVTITVKADRGTFTIPELDLPAYLAPGSGLEFNIPIFQGGEWMDIEIRVQEEDGREWDDAIYYLEWKGSNIVANISWADLQQKQVDVGHTLIISAGGGRPGWNVRGWERRIPIIDLQDDATPEATISFDDQMGTDVQSSAYNAMVNTELRLTVRPKVGRTPAAGEETTIQDIRFFNGDQFQWNNKPDPNDGLYHPSINRGNEGTFSIYAMVTYTKWNDEWENQQGDPRTWYPTNVLEVTFTSDGEVNPFTISLDKTTVARGESIQATIQIPEITAESSMDAGDNAADFNFEIEYTNCEWHWIEENDTASIATTYLRPGKYRVRAVGSAVSLCNYETPWQTITVTAPVLPEGQRILFTINGQSTGTVDVWVGGETLEACIIAPGATKVGFFEDGRAWHVDKDGNYDWGESDSWYDNDYLYWMYENDVGEHTLQACAWFPEENGEEYVTSSEITVNVKREAGSILFDTTAIPVYFTANEACTFTIAMPVNADYMNFSVRQVWEDSSAAYGWTGSTIVQEDHFTDKAGNGYEVTVPAGSLIAGQEIWIDMQAYGIGYPCEETWIHAKVLEKPTTNGLELAFENGYGPDANGNVLLYQDLRATLKPGSGHRLSAVQFWDGNQFHHWTNESEGNGEFFVNFEFNSDNDEGKHVLFAQYKLDNDTEWSMTKPVTLNVKTLGKLPAFTYTVTPADDQGKVSVAQGGYLTATITNLGAIETEIKRQLGNNANSYDPSKLHFHAMIAEKKQDETQGSWLIPNWVQWNGIDRILIPTAEVEVTGEATLLINYGYEDGWIGWSTQKDITITAVEDSAYFRTGKTSMATGEEFSASLHIPGASQVAVFEIETRVDGTSFESMMGWNKGETLIWNFSYGNSGTKHLIAKKQTGDHGEPGSEEWNKAWTTVNGLELFLTVTAQQNQTIQVTASVPTSITVGNGITIAWPCNVVPDKTDVQIHSVGEGGQVWHSWPMNGETSITIPATMPQRQDNDNFDQTLDPGTPVFQSGKVYRVQVYVQKIGWEASGFDAYFIVDGISAEQTLTLPGMLTTIEDNAFEGGNFSAVFIPDGVTSIGHCAFMDCGNLVYVSYPAGLNWPEDAFGGNTHVLIWDQRNN